MKSLFGLFVALFLCGSAAWAADGTLPRTLVELNRWYVEPPAGSNAATFILQGIAAMKITDADYNSSNLPAITWRTNLPPPGNPMPSAMKAAITEFVSRNQASLPFFEKAMAFEKSRYPVDLTQAEIMLPHLGGIKQAENVLKLIAWEQAEAGRAGEAGEDVLLGFGLARSLEPEPILVSQLVRIASVDTAVNSLEQVVNRVALPPGVLDQLQKSLGQSEERELTGDAFTRGLAGEMVIWMGITNLTSEKIREYFQSSELVAKAAGETKEEIRADMTFHQETISQILAGQKPLYSQAGKVFSEKASEAAKRGFYLSSITFLNYNRGFLKGCSCLAQLRLARTAVALEKFRAANGNHYPDYLSELTPDYLSIAPLDPFTGIRLHYQKKGGGYLLYSVGSDLKDDTGDRKKDIVFQVVNPPPPSRP